MTEDPIEATLVADARATYDRWNNPHDTPGGVPAGGEIVLHMADRIEAAEAENERLCEAVLALAQIARGREDCGLPLAREEARQIARKTLTELGLGWRSPNCSTENEDG